MLRIRRANRLQCQAIVSMCPKQVWVACTKQACRLAPKCAPAVSRVRECTGLVLGCIQSPGKWSISDLDTEYL